MLRNATQWVGLCIIYVWAFGDKTTGMHEYLAWIWLLPIMPMQHNSTFRTSAWCCVMNLRISNSSLATLYLRNQPFFSPQYSILNKICKNRTILRSKIIRPSHLKVSNLQTTQTTQFLNFKEAINVPRSRYMLMQQEARKLELQECKKLSNFCEHENVSMCNHQSSPMYVHWYWSRWNVTQT